MRGEASPAARSERARGVRAALVGGLAAIAVAIAVALARAPLIVAGTNSVAPKTIVAETKGGTSACQGGETIPGGTTAVRLWITGNVKPSVSVIAQEGPQTVTSGATSEQGWLGKVVTVPVARVSHTAPDAQLCFTIDRAVEEIDLFGGGAPHPLPGESRGKVRIEYLRPGPSSWWSLASAVTRRLGLGRAPAGAWVFLIPLVAMLLAALIVARTILRELGRRARLPGGARRARVPPGGARRARVPLPGGALLARRRLPGGAFLARVPGPAWACAAVACLSAVSWSIVSPPFQVTDEPSHFAYTQILAESGRPPRSHSADFSPDEVTALRDLDQSNVRFNPGIGTISSVAQERRLQRDLALPLSRIGHGAAVATPEPPLYYALESIPYHLASSGTLLDQLELMRLLSALMAAFTAIFTYLFLREALPGTPWAWTVGALGTALAPLLGFISGAVNPDAMLAAVSAALFYTLARAFRHGLTPRTATAIGAVTAIGFLTKLNFIGLAPGTILALLILTHRARHTSKKTAHRSLTIALTIGLAPLYTYIAINLLTNHAGLGWASKLATENRRHHGSLAQELSYVWQCYLPRLPGMSDYFPGISTIRELWFDRLVGLYGWLDTHFATWVYNAALVPAGLIAALCARELVRTRAALRARAGELLSYTAMGLGLLAILGEDSYLEHPPLAGAYSEPRYLLPLAVLFAAAFALAARGAGRRWGPAVGTLLVLLILAHDIFSQLLVVGRFYV